jgi:hypothetical protein
MHLLSVHHAFVRNHTLSVYHATHAKAKAPPAALHKVARRRKQRSKLFERSLVFVGEAVQLGAVNVDDSHDLRESVSRHPLLVGAKLTFPSLTIGTTISLLLAPSHAMWPGNMSTSGTSCVVAVLAAAPHTPRPSAIVWHATWPWNGPRSSCAGFDGVRK